MRRGLRTHVARSLSLALRRLGLLALLIAAGGTPVASAQDMLLQMWPSVGLGPGLASAGADGRTGWSARAGVHLVFGQWVLTGRQTATDGGASRFDTGFGRARASYHESAVLLGYTPPGRLHGHIVVSAGLARVWGERVQKRARDSDPCIQRLFGDCRAYYYESFEAVWGLALEAGAYRRAFWIVDYGLTLHANVNAEQPVAGATLGLRIGRGNR